MRRLLAVLVLAVLVAACAGEPPTPQADDLSGPLTALPECTGPQAPTTEADVPGVILPVGAVLTSVTESGPVTQVTGYVNRTPVQVREAFEARADVEKLTLEDEIFEMEGLLGREGYRTYLKVTAVCDRGSQFIAVVAQDVVASGLPVPQGTGAASPAAVGG